ncbi:MAG: hypothetical protein Q4F88_06120, partial [Eubacteriales bacterium]|nr:hypothetical protein [Eubacteriales bacterium]
DTYYLSKILMYLCVLYTLYEKINIKPIYNKNSFEGYVILKGNFRLIFLLITFIKLYKNHKFREFLKEIKRGEKNGK